MQPLIQIRMHSIFPISHETLFSIVILDNETIEGKIPANSPNNILVYTLIH